jgi:hypothetical protein
MAEATAGKIVLTTADGVPLKRKLRQTQQQMKRRAFGLVLPLLAFIVITFVWPIGLMVFRSVDNPVVPEFMPNAAAALAGWDSQEGGVPPEDVFAIVAQDLVRARKDKTVGKVATRLNYELPGSRSLITSSARKLSRVEEGPWKEAMINPGGESGHYRRLHPARLSDLLSDGNPAAADQQPVDDPGAAAVLDLAAGAHDLVDRAVADRGGAERHHGCGRARWR